MPKILLVDDSPVIRGLIKRYLRDQSDLEAEIVESGAAALASIRQGAPQALVTDLNMPEMDGLTLLLTVRALPGLERLPVAVFGGGDEEGRRAALEAGADELLVKPFEASALVETIRRLLSPRPAPTLRAPE